MDILKTNINSSPFLGVFCSASEKFALVPFSTSKKQIHEIEQKLGVKAVQTSMGNSSLIGVLSVLFEDKIVLSEIVEENEKEHLQKNGLKIKQLKGHLAIGNMVSLNKNGGIASRSLSKKEVKALEDFFGVKLVQKDIAGSNLAGSAIAVTNKGFIVHPNVKEKEFLEIKKIFKVDGNPTTANYGDRFVGNDVVANSKGALIGSITTTFEMIRIDEALRGN